MALLFFYKWLLIVFLKAGFPVANNFERNYSIKIPHPFHVSVTEINHNAKDKTLEISCKIFTDDFSSALAKKYKTTVDLIHPADKAVMDKIVSDYILNHIQVKVDNKAMLLNYVGYEIESEAAYVYLQVNDIAILKKADVTDTILYDMFTDQTGIVHVIENGNRKSEKIDYPATQASFQF